VVKKFQQDTQRLKKSSRSRDKIKSNDVRKFNATVATYVCSVFSGRVREAGYERVKSSVFNFRLNTGSDGDEETKGGKLFQTPAAAIENVKLAE